MDKIIESNDYPKLTYLFHESGLEVEPGIERPDNVVKCWECIDEAGRLLGAASLEIRSGEYVVADVAVDRNYQGENIGTRLMETVEAEIASLGGKDAWLIAKVPLFYAKLGWEPVEREQAPDISKCFFCLKYGKECKPQVMHKRMAAASIEIQPGG